jgi:vancomycin permeability regulator SanA
MEYVGIVIFGAAVMADGRPSPSLLRRIGYGRGAAMRWPQAPVFCSGGVGRAGPSEASIMAKVLADSGIAPARLVLDEASLDTLQSVVAAARFVHRRGLDGCVICSDRYHLPRIRLMLAALGVRTLAGPMAPGRGGTRLRYWLRMHLREALAVPYDLAIVLARRQEFLAAIAAP